MALPNMYDVVMRKMHSDNSPPIKGVKSTPQLFTKLHTHRLEMAISIFTLLFLYFFYSRYAHTEWDDGCGCDKNDLTYYRKTFFLPYVDKFKSESVPLMKATINGSDFKLPMDTGSTGVLIGAPLLPDVDASKGKPSYEYLSSSNILYNGNLVDLPITFHGEKKTYVTATVPVLVVEKSVKCPWYNAEVDNGVCPPNPDGPPPTPRDLSKITYMGVGFGRNKPGDGQPNAIPAANPFLNIGSINGRRLKADELRTGYTLSTKGVYLGLTSRNTHDFVWADLPAGVTHDTDPRDWAMVPMCFSLNDEGNNCGSALIDTGINQMYLRTDVGVVTPNVTVKNPKYPKYSKNKYVTRVKPGTKIAIGFPSNDEKGVAGYIIEVGKKSPVAPAYVVPGKQSPPPFVNTGRNFIFGWDVAFDAIGGRFGFRPTSPPNMPPTEGPEEPEESDEESH
ncbi:hypothetical protein K469DRAFT_177368 [Zopfia rhizophila CBS 207.26]|uniref:Acid protease n=1 Tax=Zopfia rhizophila CBS 207.26 TaxID=1314779 RepID=A0A6A6E086_9PEZI|nr:hypothetical protein K469DRAFT_177368 [Zopfia rhizophila CBS 207.26]